MGVEQNVSRNAPLDFVKGLLVIAMVVYHEMNYFSTAGPEGFGHVRFVTGSFIFISGYIISTFYEKKYRTDRVATSKRLLIRGLKLLMIFSALNLLIHLTGFGNPNKGPFGIQRYLSNLLEIYGSGSSRVAAFQILLPISYLLLISPIFLYFSGFKKTCIITTLLIAFGFSFLDIDSGNLSLGIVGLIGLSVGMGIKEIKSTFFIKSKLFILCSLVLCIYFMKYLNTNLLTYSIGIMILLKLCYELGKNVDLRTTICKWVILFGQYTLVCYVMQIAFLQLLLRILPKQRWGLGYETIFIFIATNMFLLALCLLLRTLRYRYGHVDKSYKIIFA